jgi:hypothetical protein
MAGAIGRIVADVQLDGLSLLHETKKGTNKKTTPVATLSD